MMLPQKLKGYYYYYYYYYQASKLKIRVKGGQYLKQEPD